MVIYVSRGLGVFLSALLLLSVLGVPAMEPSSIVKAAGVNEISSCGVVINEPGYYVISTDLQGGGGTCIFVNTSNVTIDGGGHWLNGTSSSDSYGISTGKGHQRTNLTIKNVKFGKWRRALYLEGAVNSRVFNNTFSDNFYSVELPFAENLEVYDNLFEDNLFGIDMYYGTKNTKIHDNEIYLSGYLSIGVSLSGDTDYPVINNSISNNRIIAPLDPTGRNSLIAIDVEHDVMYNKIIGNYILNSPIELPNGAHWNTTVENNTIEYSTFVLGTYGIHLFYPRNDTIRNNLIKNASVGIFNIATNNTCICDNTIYNAFIGIAEGSQSFTDFGKKSYYNLTNNIVSGNTIHVIGVPGLPPQVISSGIYLFRDNPNALVSNITIVNNTVEALSPNVGAGVVLYGVTDTLVGNNTVSGTNTGLVLSATTNFRVESNNLYPLLNGTFINGSTNGVLAGNVISASSFSLVLNSSSSIAIYNNILNSTNGVKFTGSYNFITFNTTKTRGSNIVGGPYIGGNFWAKPDGSGFSETCQEDENKDGICDTPYEVYPQEVDELPLTYPPLLPDLTVKKLSTTLIDPSKDKYKITMVVTNIGQASSGETELIVEVNGTKWEFSVPELSPGGAREYSVLWEAPQKGVYIVTAIVDPGYPEDAVVESNEDNNEVSGTLSVEAEKKETPPWEEGRNTFGVLFDLWNLWTAWFFVQHDELPGLYQRAIEQGVTNETLERVKTLNETAVKTIKEAWRDDDLESIRAKKWRYLKSTVLWYKAREAYMLEKEAVEILKKALGIS